MRALVQTFSQTAIIDSGDVDSSGDSEIIGTLDETVFLILLAEDDLDD